ncbi:MAG TPA: hypothetical protein PLG17_03780 [Thermodesulfobacteriota bacterium]|nr:hypothetical protein [Deltaproteobacteria bacterium]HQO77612.1 hypothetical protein [Thermodesulfobacteriota bacterium]
MEDFVTIAHFNNLAEAYTMRALLEASDVPVLVLDDQTAGVNWLVIPAMGGVRLQTKPEHVERALEVLHVYSKGDLDSEEEANPGLDVDDGYVKKSQGKRFLAGLVALFLVNPLVLAASFLAAVWSRERKN